MDERLEELHGHLEATAELPVDREASRWLGEAEAVAGDLAGRDVERSVVEDRVEVVLDLLAEVDGTGDPEADDRVEAARSIAEGILGGA